MTVVEHLAVLRDMRQSPERWPGGVSIEVMARNDWAMLRAWRQRKGIG